MALGTVLCFSTLIAASGPHLVHHLGNLHPVHSHSYAGKSQSTDCRVLSLVHHTPGTRNSSDLLPVSLPAQGHPGCELLLLVIATPRPVCQARSPPVLSPS
jgi:hypothetical protein